MKSLEDLCVARNSVFDKSGQDAALDMADAEDFRYDSVFRRVASNAGRDLVQQQIFEWDYLSIFYNFSNIWLKSGLIFPAAIFSRSESRLINF